MNFEQPQENESRESIRELRSFLADLARADGRLDIMDEDEQFEDADIIAARKHLTAAYDLFKQFDR